MRLKWMVIVLVVGVAILIGKWPKTEVVMGCQPVTSDGNIEVNPGTAFFNNKPLTAQLAYVDTLSNPEKKVLGANSNKWIEVDLSDQKLIAHEGDGIFVESLISSGLFGKTPPGEYTIWYKIRSTKMEGGVKGTRSYYYLPNVPYSMFFYGDYGIHGTYWHNNFGQPMSHGCVNTPTPIAERLFYWADPQLPSGKGLVRATAENPGTRVVIHQ